MINLENFINEIKNSINKNSLVWKDPNICKFDDGGWELEWILNTTSRLFIFSEDNVIYYLHAVISNFNEGLYSEEKFIELWKWLND